MDCRKRVLARHSSQPAPTPDIVPSVQAADDNPPPEIVADIAEDAIAYILEHEDPERFLRWFRDEVAARDARRSDLFESGAEFAALAFGLGRALWNAVPLPGNGFRPKPLPAPQRNDACPCGSGRKYKRCCGTMPAPALDSHALWPLVISRLPASALREAIASGSAPTDALLGLAIECAETGRPKKALRFLEPLFEGKPRGTDADHGYALDLLCSLYEELGFTKKKSDLLDRVTRDARRSPLRSSAWQRLAAISIDGGDSERAWECFRSAQRDDPNSPSLGVLEVQFLITERKHDRAQERASYWVKRLRNKGFPPGEQPLEFLSAVARGPQAAMADMGIEMARGAGRGLMRWLGEVADRAVPDYTVSAEPPARLDDGDWETALRRHLRGFGLSDSEIRDSIAELRPPDEVPGPDPEEHDEGADDTCFLVPPSRVAALEQSWHDVFAVPKPFGTGTLGPFHADAWDPLAEEDWMAFLEEHPEAFDSLDVLDDLATVVLGHELRDLPGVDEMLLLPILRRVKVIVDRALAGHEDARLVWSYLENRPPVRCLVHLVFLEERLGNARASAELAERVLSLNPDDNHGLRSTVINNLLREGDDERALELATAYPEDLQPDVPFGGVLALFRLGRRDEAQAAVAEAVDRLPKIPRFLTAQRVRRPKLEEFGVLVGGDDQAWIYREDMREVWRSTPGALEWLKRAAKTARKPARD